MANLEVNPITGQLDLVGTSASYIDGDVEYHSNLPVALGSPSIDSAYLVRKGQGVYFLTRKPAGIWVRELNNGNLDDWKYAGTFSDLFRDANFRLINSTYVSKELAFDLSAISENTTRTLTAPNASGTVALTSDFAAPPAIGVTTRNTGAFSTLSTTGNIAMNRLGEGCLITNVNPSADLLIGVTGGGSVRFFGSGYGAQSVTFTNAMSGGFIFSGNNVVEMRNGTSPCGSLILNNTFTSSTNYERGFLRWSSNVLQIGTEKGSAGGLARAMELRTNNVARITLGNAGEIGFFGAAAAAQPTAVADATDAASVITQLNALLTRMRTLGLLAA